jgi:hypothetical protein
MFSTTFNNISVISWRSLVGVVEGVMVVGVVEDVVVVGERFLFIVYSYTMRS